MEYVRKEKKDVLLNDDNDNDNEHNNNNYNCRLDMINVNVNVNDDIEKSDSVGVSIIQDSEKMRNDKMMKKYIGMYDRMNE
jgi:hypothetical protein